MKARLLTLLVLASAAVCGETPYGICAHVTTSDRDPARVRQTLLAAELASIGCIRSDVRMADLRRADGSLDFTAYDRLVADLAARNIRWLPILYGLRGRDDVARYTAEDFRRYGAFVETFIRHFGVRVPVVEIWNEANLDHFFKGADPVLYAKLLRTAHAAVKRANPSVRVAFTGTAGVPLDWIEKAFKAGATDAFDIMNVHPYSHPRAPEGILDVKLEGLRALLAKHGCGDRPVWVTELGWPTQAPRLTLASVLLAGLKTARPEQKTWRVVLADCQAAGEVSDQSMAEQLRDALPSGSSVRACSQAETIRRLKAREADAVAYPFDETFPADTIDAVNDFIHAGGVFVDFGGTPCCYGRRGDVAVEGLQDARAVERFPFGVRTKWSAPRGAYPADARVYATPAGRAAGVRQEPTGFRARRYLAPDRAGPDAEWIPLVAGRTAAGVELVAAGVIRYRGERKGAAVLCTILPDRGVFGTNTEENQARYTSRALGLAFAEGVAAYFPYNLRAKEEDPFYSEHHFGLMHADFTPKPAYAAYGAFIRARPVGSVQTPGAWHDSTRTLFYPQWTCPDGTRAGMVWTTGPSTWRELSFSDGEPTFFDVYGRKMATRSSGDGRCSVEVSGAPVFFLGARLVVAETALWQEKIDVCARAGGGRVTVGPGRHLVGQLELRSNVELHLTKGAVLEGVTGLSNYRVLKLPYSEGTWSAIVFGVGVTNVAVTGEGEIFGNGRAWNPPEAARDAIGCREGLRPRGLFFADASGIRLEGFLLRDAACWGVVFKRCENVVARAVRIDSVVNRNNDGFDIEARNVLIERCDVNSGDDAYCIKSNDPGFVVENVVVRDCVARSHCNALKLGTASHGTMRNIRFENCRVAAPTRVYRDLMPMPADLSKDNPIPGVPTYLCGAGIGAICVECVDGGTVENIVFDGIDVSGCQVPIFVRGGKRTSRSCGIPPSDRHVLRDIVIRRVRGRAESEHPSSITGVAGCRPQNIRLEDVALACRGGRRDGTVDGEPGFDSDGAYPEANMFRKLHLPAYGLYVRNADAVTLENVRFDLRPDAPPDESRPPVFGIRPDMVP